MLYFEELIFFLYEGFRGVPFLIIFIVVYPYLWKNKARLRRSFNFLTVFSIYVIFFIPGMIYTNLHSDGLFHRVNKTFVHEKILSDTEILTMYEDEINDYGYFDYDDCKVYNVRKNFTHNSYNFICNNEEKKYIYSLVQDKKSKELNMKVDFVFEDGTRFYDYPFFGVNVDTYISFVSKITDSGDFDMKNPMNYYEVVFNKDVDYDSVNNNELVYTIESNSKATFYLKVIGLDSMYFVYLK